MADLPEANEWVPVTQIETAEPVVGGLDGISNRGLRELVSRTGYLKATLEAALASFANNFASKTGNYPTLRARGTEAEDVGLGNVANYTATAATNDASTSKYALAGGVKKAFDTAVTALAAAAAAELPSKTIIMWFGAENAVPAGWAICNGQNGTPDMRGRVPVGVGTGYALNSKGGEKTATTSSNGGHSHRITVNSRTLTISNMPPHRHGIMTRGSGGGDVVSLIEDAGIQTSGDAFLPGAGNWVTNETGGGTAHNHSASSSSGGGHGHTVNVEQPYFCLHFIMKT